VPAFSHCTPGLKTGATALALLGLTASKLADEIILNSEILKLYTG